MRGDPTTAVRGLLAAALAVLLATGAHVAGGGAVPDWRLVGLAWLLLLPPARWLLHRERGLLPVVAATAAAELGVHAAFTLSSRAGSLSAALLLCHRSGSLLPAHLLGPALRSAAPGWHLSGELMLGAHAVGTAGLASWLRAGERVAFASLRQCGCYLRDVVGRWLPLPAGCRSTRLLKQRLRRAPAVLVMSVWSVPAPGRAPPRGGVALAHT